MQTTPCDQVIAPTCNIRFDGPFVVSLAPEGLVAFVPRDSMRENMPRHYLFLDRDLVGCDDGSQQYDFSLANDQGYCGIKVNDCPTKIDPRFKDFRVRSACHCDDYFLKVSIPYPKSIWLSEKPVTVKFADNTDGLMPLNHICEYDVDPANNGIAITSKEMDRNFCVPSDRPFLFQVGISQFSNMSKEHALHFYNEVISACFPQGSCRRLKDIDPRHTLSLDVDCKLGGVIGG